jgi:hypothetical protein
MANNTTRNITYPTSGDSITPLETVFATLASTTDAAMGNLDAGDIKTGALAIARGGTGATTAAAALTALGGVSSEGYNVAGKNKLINADFNIWQRSGSGTTSISTTGYFPDRWRYVLANGSSKVFTQSRQTFTPGNQPEAGYEGKYFYRIAVTTAGSGYTAEYIEQPIEDVRTLAGKKVVVSFWAKVSSGTMTLTPQLVQNFGTGGSSAVTSSFTAQSVGTSWTRFTATLTTTEAKVPNLAGKTVGTAGDDYLALRLVMPNNTIQTLDIWGVQLEEGTTATRFNINGVNQRDELASCQRYYYRLQADAVGLRFGMGSAISTGSANFVQPFPVTMRTKPAAIETTGTASDYRILNASGASVAASSVPAFVNATPNSTSFTIASTYTAAGNAVIWASAASTAYLAWSAEF